MPKYSKRSLDVLSELAPDLQTIMRYAINYMDITLLCGYRGREAQEDAVATGKSMLHFPNSKHNVSPALAVDVAPYPIDWEATGRFWLTAGAILMLSDILLQEGKITHGIRWLGTSKLADLPHFEIITKEK
jgi:peptidoglycan L-alanyl-D-glutamate endopeptidase CwlK